MRYVCGDCMSSLGIKETLKAENQVGRKFCDICGSNEDDLYIDDDEYELVEKVEK